MKIFLKKVEPIILIVISIFVVFYSYKSHISIDGFISAGLFSFIAGILIFVSSCFMLFAKKEKNNDKHREKPNIDYKHFLVAISIFILSILFFYFLIDRINFFILSLFYILFILLLLREKKIFYIIALPIISNIFLYIIFSVFLKVF